MSSVTVRIKEADKQTIDELGSRFGESTQTIIHQAVEEYRRRRMLGEANKAYALLRSNPDEWNAELAEREAWDATVADGPD